MLNKTIENNLSNLSLEKKYDELIQTVEKISMFEDKTPSMMSIFGI